MKLQVLILGGFLCLGTAAWGQTSSQSPQNTQDKNTQSADRLKAPQAGDTVTGCVDEQNGHYVLRDVKTDQLIRLQPSGANADNDFARFVGHQAQAIGSVSSGTMTVNHISQVADMCPVGK
jgi:hypothetical protein